MGHQEGSRGPEGQRHAGGSQEASQDVVGPAPPVGRSKAPHREEEAQGKGQGGHGRYFGEFLLLYKALLATFFQNESCAWKKERKP